MKTSSRRDEGCPDGADAFDGEENDQVRSSSVMTRILTVFALLAATAAAQTPTGVPVLVELFTSEGCSSCPPADALLAELSGPRGVPGAEVVPLSLHVDYWNRLGWTDPFSSAAFSERQASYAKGGGIDAPQVVGDGGVEVVGSDRTPGRAARAAAPRPPKVPLEGRAAPSGPVPPSGQVRAA